MGTNKKSIKDRVKAKAKAVKEKLKGSKAKKAVSLAFLCAFCALAGCMTPNQASRGTSNENGDFEPSVDVTVTGSSNTVSVVIRGTYGDGAIASSDSSGSTESQTQTPTLDIRPDIDLNYNDAIAGATTASKDVLAELTDLGKQAVLSMMARKVKGVVEVEKKDGTIAKVECNGGQCSLCTDCGPK